MLRESLNTNKNICILSVSYTNITEPLVNDIRDKVKENEKRKRFLNEKLAILQVLNIHKPKLTRSAIVLIQKYM